MVAIFFFYHCPLALALWSACIESNAKIDLVREMELSCQGEEVQVRSEEVGQVRGGRGLG